MKLNANMVNEQVDKYKGQVDGFVDKVLGLIGNHPWTDWLAKTNGFVEKYIPVAIALVGLLGCVTGVIMMIRIDAPFSLVMNQLWVIIPVIFAMHLAPKALFLVRSLVEKSEELTIRPELLYILKILFGLGGILLGIILLLRFDGDLVAPAIISIVFAILMIISLGRPEIVSVKSGYPTNCVEEVIALVLFPVRVVLVLISLLVGVGIVGGLIYGIALWFKSGLFAAGVLDGFAVLPLVLPLAVYVGYLSIVFVVDFYRAIVSIPRKIDELKK